VAGLVVAANLRPAVASVGPELDRLRSGLSMSSAAAAVLTAVPVFCFGALAAAGPWLSRRLGLRTAVAALVALMIAGLVLRIGPDIATLFAGTVVAASGIAAANVLLPVVIKRDFAARTGLMMGLYTTAVTGGAAAAAGLTVPIGDAIGHGWRGGLGIWALAAALALLMWLPYVRRGPARPAAAIHRPAGLHRRRLAWMITLFFGLQSLSFYAVLGWLPSLYRSHGYSAAAAGGLLSLSALVQIPTALLLPALAGRMRRQQPLVLLAVMLTGAGLLAILVAPTAAAVLWVVILGLGQGAAFALALTLLVLRTRSHAATAPLSAMAQSVGYLIAGLGPLAVGALHAATGGWTAGLILLLALLVPEAVAGLRAAAPGFIDPLPEGTAHDPS
jgi:CP family cyanate transporter-like MFS transporter